MIYVGVDDTDVLDAPGTNQLARLMVMELASQASGRMILRHQLLEDPRVPCTKKNGCASIAFEPCSGFSLTRFIESLRGMVLSWAFDGSDPGLCVAEVVSPAVCEWGKRCQSELVAQADARELAAQHGVHLEGLGGTQDGVIGALAAVGLMASKNDGRVIYHGSSEEDWYNVTGCMDIAEIHARGVDEVLDVDTGQAVVSGMIDVGKRLRPNFRAGKIVLYAAKNELPHWEAVRRT